jgi:hypothetical protein
MAKGSGLSIDSADPFGFFPHRPILLNSFPEDSSNTTISRNIHKWKLSAMDATLNGSTIFSSLFLEFLFSLATVEISILLLKHVSATRFHV